MTTHNGAGRVETSLFITVSGPPGVGVTTLCEGLSEALDCPYVSGGQVFRELADERGVTLTQLVAEASESDEIDRALDRRLRTIAEKWATADKPFILESRLAGWLAGENADLRVYLDAPEDVRADRPTDDEEMTAEMRVREVIEAGRYESWYGVDVTDRSIYDLTLNTARWSPDGVLNLVLAAVEEYDGMGDEGPVPTPEMDV
jgi:cytidylate kinase